MALELRAAEESRFSVFLSSPDEDLLVKLRDRVVSLVEELNAVLHWQREDFRFEVVRWVRQFRPPAGECASTALSRALGCRVFRRR